MSRQKKAWDADLLRRLRELIIRRDPEVFEAVRDLSRAAHEGYAGLMDLSRASQQVSRAQLPSATAYTDQGNTFSGGVQSFSGGMTLHTATSDPGSGLAEGRIFQRSDTGVVRIYHSGAWQDIAGAGGGITGTLTSGEVVVATGSGTVDSYAQFKWDDSAKTFKLGDFSTKTLFDHRAGTINDDAPAAFIVATAGDDQTGDQVLLNLSFTTADSGSDNQIGQVITLGSGYSGSGFTAGLDIANAAAGTGTSIPFAGNMGIRVGLTASTAGTQVGVYASASGGSTGKRFGLWGTASGSDGSGVYMGVMGNTGAFSGTRAGGLFYTGTSLPSSFASSAGLICDSMGSLPSIVCQSNGTEIFSVLADDSVRSSTSVGVALCNKAGTEGQRVLPLEITTTNSSTPTEMWVDGTNFVRLPSLADGDTYGYTVHVTARGTAGTNDDKSAYYVRSFVVSRVSSTTTIVASNSDVTLEESGVSAWDLTLDIPGGQHRPAVMFTGDNATTIKVRGWAELTKVS